MQIKLWFVTEKGLRTNMHNDGKHLGIIDDGQTGYNEKAASFS